MKRLFLTGGNGYVGKYLLPTLLKNHYKIDLLLLNRHDDKLFNHNNINIIHGDLRNKELLIKTVANNDIIIHLGAIVGSHSLSENMDINYEGTKNLIESCKINNIKRLIFISSVSATRIAQGPYGLSKKLAEEAVVKSGLDYTILRPTTIMGRESFGLNRIIKNVNRFKLFIPMVGSGNYTRHPIYVMDFIDLINKTINSFTAYNKVYEVGGEKVIRFRDLVKLVNSKLGNRNKPIIPIPKQFIRVLAFFLERIFDVPPFTREHVNALGENTNMDTSSIKKDLNFKPTKLEDMLDIIIDKIIKDPPKLL